MRCATARRTARWQRMEGRGLLGHAILEEVMFASLKEPALRRFEGRHEQVGLDDGHEKGVTKDGPRNRQNR
jgi:hypothetical protein